MRYLGNKTSLVENIRDCLFRHDLYRDGLIFFDAFCGTGAVSYAVRNKYNIILNDNLLLATTFAKGRIVADMCSFENLGFNPFDYFNSNENTLNGFFSQNYAPLQSGRTYFTDFNAGRIDYIRYQISIWYDEHLINDKELAYLLCSLQESISKVANVAGVYGACLKKWDPRAIKPLIFQDPDGYMGGERVLNAANHIVETRNANIEDIIQDVNCDIVYLDPPYTKNKYNVQYHILETVVRDDKPLLHGKTGARSYTNISDGWSKPYEVEVLFEKTIAKTTASHILLSYSTDGLMTKDYILNVLKRHCYEDSIELIEIPYKKYCNIKTSDSERHCEYLFYGKKKDVKDIYYCCPLNYMGGKANVIDKIRPHLEGKRKFIDLFGGGLNVGVNTSYSDVIYNDINFVVVGLLRMFRDNDTASLLKFLDKTIEKYGLKKADKEAYSRIRNDYNEKFRNGPLGYQYLYTTILYGFQQQIRFNSRYEFNNPVGESGYNDCIKEKIVSFSRRLKEMEIDFHIGDFQILLNQINEEYLIYADPPYLITLGSYNDGKRGFNGWSVSDETRLLDFLDVCWERGAKIVVSNIMDYEESSNDLLKKWIKKHNIKPIGIEVRKRKEVLLVLTK